MPVQVDTPTAKGSTNEWKIWPSSAGSVVQAVQTNDGDTSVVYAVSNAAPKTQLYTFPPITGVTDPVNSASITAVARRYYPGTGAQTFKLMWNGTGVNKPDATYGFGNTGLLKNYYTCTVSNPDISLVLASVNGEHGFWMRGTGGYEIFVTHHYRTVDFDYSVGSAGEFAYLIGSLAGAAIGAGLMLRELPNLARHMARWVGGQMIRLRPDEYEPAWRAWRERRNAVVV